MDALDLKVIEDIEKHGWSDMSIFPVEGHPGLPFNYTVGFSTHHDQPELLIMGMDHRQMHGVLSSAFARMEDGERFRAGEYFNEVLVEHRVAFVEIAHPVDTEYPMTMTRRLMGDFKALQLVWPDMNDRFPWHVGFDKDYLDHQELLGPWKGDL
jgi:hypothetical protein